MAIRITNIRTPDYVPKNTRELSQHYRTDFTNGITGTVDTDEITALAVTGPKIAALAVDHSKLALGAVHIDSMGGDITAAGTALLDDADAAAQRVTLGLGTAATKNTGTSGTTVPLLDGANTYSATQTFSVPPIVPTYTVAGVPSAATYARGLIYVSDESGGAVLAFSDGTNWRRVTDRAIVS